MYNRTTITQLSKCKVELQHNYKQKIYIFFVVPGNHQALLDMPDIDMLNIITINFTSSSKLSFIASINTFWTLCVPTLLANANTCSLLT